MKLYHLYIAIIWCPAWILLLSCTKSDTPKEPAYQTGEQVGIIKIKLDFTPPLTVTGIYYADYKNVYYNLKDVTGKKFSNISDENLERYNP